MTHKDFQEWCEHLTKEFVINGAYRPIRLTDKQEQGLYDYIKNNITIGCLNNGSSRFVYKNKSTDYIIKFAGCQAGLLQNENELQMFKETYHYHYFCPIIAYGKTLLIMPKLEKCGDYDTVMDEDEDDPDYIERVGVESAVEELIGMDSIDLYQIGILTNKWLTNEPIYVLYDYGYFGNMSEIGDYDKDIALDYNLDYVKKNIDNWILKL